MLRRAALRGAGTCTRLDCVAGGQAAGEVRRWAWASGGAEELSSNLVSKEAGREEV